MRTDSVQQPAVQQPAVQPTAVRQTGEAGRSAAAEGALRFREVAGRFATGVAVVTSIADGVPFGTTVNAFTTVSIEPTLLLVCLNRRSRLLSAIGTSSVFTVTVLAADQRQCARWFASKSRPTGPAAFDGVPVRPAPVTGCPVLTEGIAYFDCRADRRYAGGDHVMIMGEVVKFGFLRPTSPLLFVDGSYAGEVPEASTGKQGEPRA